MKKLILAVFVCGLMLFGLSDAWAGLYIFQPKPKDLQELDHWYYYAWVINWSPPSGEVITEAVLKFKNIYDWRVESGDSEDHLYSHLLDNPNTSEEAFINGNAYSTSWKWYDAQVGGDNWENAGPLIGDWSDPQGGSERDFNLKYRFSTLGLLDELNTYVQDGVFGFGFDPDCHYYNDKIVFRVKTEIIPEPATLSLLGLGLVGVLGLRRRRVKS